MSKEQKRGTIPEQDDQIYDEDSRYAEGDCLSCFEDADNPGKISGEMCEEDFDEED